MADIADPLPPSEPAPVAAAPEAATDTYVPVFRKELKKKDAEQEDAEFASAKAYLSTKYGKDSQSVYDHLTSLVSRILETKPANALEVFESISSKVKRSKFTADAADSAVSLKAVPEISGSVELSKEQLAIFNHHKADDGSNAEQGEIPDIMDLSNLWDWAGLSFGKEEIFVVLVSLKKLVDEKPLKSVRLWGKVFGTSKNYIVVEAELKDGVVDEEDAIANPKPEVTPVSAPAEEEAAPKSPEEDETDAPKPKQKPVTSLPIEQRAGVNKYVYYVSNYAGGAWMRLPDVIPEKLQISRQIRKYFSGDLSRQIVSFPAFNGTEALYLRCQIARISAATVVSPSGYYIPDPDEETENGENATIIINTEFEGLPGEQLLNPGNWVHHVPYILPQGRMTWENPVAPKPVDEEEKDEEEEEKEPEEETAVDPETGPTILGPIAADAENGDAPAWTSRLTSTLSPSKFAPVVLRSTRWPGAVVVSYNDKFANVYMGDGLKDLGSPAPFFAPPSLPAIQGEYVAPEDAPEILNEQIDPSIEAEAAIEAEKLAKEEAAKAQQEGGEAEEPEEDE